MKEATWTKVAMVNDIEASIPYLIHFMDKDISLYRVQDVVYATDDTCSHAEASLCEGEYHEYTVTCPRHGGQFDIRTGVATKMPAFSPIRVFPVSIKNDAVYMSPEDL